ncbi:MAG: CTP pyrophosphohydrolase [Firmicutes bacterium ADurb.Bin182]|nr:MAG: CTP pyrophosphohydrolase [Firmicutes bacterium ADurb.Bin182]
MIEVVAALIREDNKFMICQRPVNKARGLLWEFVGGKVEQGETKEQALIRECQEELAITISVGKEFMDVVHEYPDITVHLTLFNASIIDGKLKLLEHLPEGTRKILALKKDVRTSNSETLASYYCRIYGHLLEDISIWEIDNDANMFVVR